MVIQNLKEEEILQILSEIPDPEIPVVNIRELGIVRKVNIGEDRVTVFITPTYFGCPALKTIENEIIEKLQNTGIEPVQVEYIYSPPWTTDWITDEAEEKLRKYGIAPPKDGFCSADNLTDIPTEVKCTRCNSLETELVSIYGSTACKALYKCLNCKEPFEYFKQYK